PSNGVTYRRVGELAMRICLGSALVAAAIVGSLGQAVAQPYHYPRDYYDYDYGPPPPYYPLPPARGYYARPSGADYYDPPPEGYYPPYGPGYRQAGSTPSAYPPNWPYYTPRAPGGWIAGLPAEDQPEVNQTTELPSQFRRQ